MGKNAPSAKQKDRASELVLSKVPEDSPDSREDSVVVDSRASSVQRHKKICKKDPASRPAHPIVYCDESQVTKPTLSAEAPDVCCKLHPGQRIEFLCKNKACLLELCSFCILVHKEHIEEISPLRDIINENIQNFEELNIKQLQNTIYSTQTKCISDFGELIDKLKTILYNKINCFKDQLVTTDEKIFSQLDHFKSFKKVFRGLAPPTAAEVSPAAGPARFSPENIRILKQCLQSSNKTTTNGFVIEEKIILDQFSKILSNNINFTIGGVSLNTTCPGTQKFLHWFEWEKRDLHLFNVIDYSYQVVKLVIPFKIPPFSRSIMVPSGEIFLIGGEDPETGAKKDVYSFDVGNMELDHSLHPKSPMPVKKFDFTLCYHKGFIYLICGKDSESAVIDTCERYDVARNQWSTIASINKRRYAASAVAVRESDKIYLFGGRSDYNNNMMEDIEEYNISQDVWRVIKLPLPNDWTPVEVCSSIQIRPGTILIFGGSDANIEDSKQSYLFHCESFRLEKASQLKKPHVFVSASFLHGNYVFAVGNEYYVKNRNIHRFNIELNEWEIVF